MSKLFNTIVVFRSGTESHLEARMSTITEPMSHKEIEQILQDKTPEEKVSFFSRLTGPPSHWESFNNELDIRPIGPSRLEFRLAGDLLHASNDAITEELAKHLWNRGPSFVLIVVFDEFTGEWETVAVG